MDKKISFSFKKKPDTRGFVKPAEEPTKKTVEYVSSISDRKIESRGGGGGGISGVGIKVTEKVIPLNVGQKISDDTPDYENTPVEGFGLAMLRGMGWKGEIDSAKPK